MLWPWGAPLIEQERLTVADMLKEQGYNTGMVGKWHLGIDWYDADGKLLNDVREVPDDSFNKG